MKGVTTYVYYICLVKLSVYKYIYIYVLYIYIYILFILDNLHHTCLHMYQYVIFLGGWLLVAEVDRNSWWDMLNSSQPRKSGNPSGWWHTPSSNVWTGYIWHVGIGRATQSLGWFPSPCSHEAQVNVSDVICWFGTSKDMEGPISPRNWWSVLISYWSATWWTNDFDG